MGSNLLRIVGNFVIFVHYTSFSISNMGLHTTTNANDQNSRVHCTQKTEIERCCHKIGLRFGSRKCIRMRLRQGPPWTLLGAYSTPPDF